MTNKARFGPAGNAENFPHASSLDAPAWLASLSLSAYEYQCGRGVKIGKETAQKLGANAKAHDIALSLHAPYYINLSADDEERIAKNINYILQSAHAAHWMGAKRVVVHTGAAGGLDRRAALIQAGKTLRRALDICDAEGITNVTLCPETMGKINQLGTLEEVLTLCADNERLLPCVDFGHLYARSHGEAQGLEQTAAMLDAMETAIGLERARTLHIHFSHIEYSKGGEVRHLTLDDPRFGPDFTPLALVLKQRGYTPVFICESAGTQAADAAAMRQIFEDSAL